MEKILREILLKALKCLNPEAMEVEIETPKEESFGDLSTPAAMSLTKLLRKPPRKIAEEIISSIEHDDIFEKIDIAGPGFINFTFSKGFLCGQLKSLIDKQGDYLTENIGNGKKVHLEFVSANPTGPLHLGHGRGAALGAALSNILEAGGYKVEKEYYINDAGRQVKLLGMSVFAKYKQLHGVDYPFPEDGYRGDYIEDIAKEFNGQVSMAKGQESDEELFNIITDFAYKKMLAAIENDLKDFGVVFDVWQSEKEIYETGEVAKSISDLKNRGHIYEQDGAVWFRSTDFGDDKDRVIVKNDGEHTYFASDIAYHRKKVESGYDEIIDIWGADHHGYIPRIKAVIEALGYPSGHFKVLLAQMVSLMKGGQPVQMSKRSGEFITLREVIDDLGKDTARFLFLTRRADSHLEIDIETAKAQSSENPVYYVQYAHARINSIFEKAKESLQPLTDFNGDLLNDEEIRIVKKLLLYKMMFKNAVIMKEPHRITYYIQEVAGMFHAYYHKHKVITEDAELTNARLALCCAIKIVIAHGLNMLGVSAPEKM